MGRNRFLVQETTHIELSDGDWIDVKRHLNNGDVKKLESCGQKPPTVVDGKVIFPVDWEVYEMERALIYLLDWSFNDVKGKPVKINMASLKAMDPADFDELQQAIFAHINKQAELKKVEREAQSRKLNPLQSPASTNFESGIPPSGDPASS